MMTDVFFSVTGLISCWAAGLLVGTVFRLTRYNERG